MECNTPGMRLRMVREKLNLSQMELAKAVNLGQAAICHYENGNRKIPGSILLLLRELYQINPDYILNGEMPLLLSSKSFADMQPTVKDAGLTLDDLKFLQFYLQADSEERGRIRSLVNYSPL